MAEIDDLLKEKESSYGSWGKRERMGEEDERTEVKVSKPAKISD